MPDISLQRDHRLGLERARAMAWQWAEHVEREYGMECSVEEGDSEDLVRFTRSGVDGTLRVTARLFAIEAKLGFLLGAFKTTIEQQIEKGLDDMLAAEASARGTAPAPAAKKQPAKAAGGKPVAAVKAAAKAAAKTGEKAAAKKR